MHENEKLLVFYVAAREMEWRKASPAPSTIEVLRGVLSSAHIDLKFEIDTIARLEE